MMLVNSQLGSNAFVVGVQLTVFQHAPTTTRLTCCGTSGTFLGILPVIRIRVQVRDHTLCVRIRMLFGTHGDSINFAVLLIDVYTSHHYTKTAEEAVAACLHGGTDIDRFVKCTETVQCALTKL